MKAKHPYRRLECFRLYLLKTDKIMSLFLRHLWNQILLSFPLQIMSLPPSTGPGCIKISPNVVLRDSYQHLHSRVATKSKVNAPPPRSVCPNPSLSLSSSLSNHAHAWAPELTCFVSPVSSQVRIPQCPLCCLGSPLIYIPLSLYVQLLSWFCKLLRYLNVHWGKNLIRAKGLGFWRFDC